MRGGGREDSEGSKDMLVCRVGHLSEGSKALQAPSHSSGKAALPPKRGEQQAVLGWVGLVSTMRPSKLLDGLVS